VIYSQIERIIASCSGNRALWSLVEITCSLRSFVSSLSSSSYAAISNASGVSFSSVVNFVSSCFSLHSFDGCYLTSVVCFWFVVDSFESNTLRDFEALFKGLCLVMVGRGFQNITVLSCLPGPAMYQYSMNSSTKPMPNISAIKNQFFLSSMYLFMIAYTMSGIHIGADTNNIIKLNVRNTIILRRGLKSYKENATTPRFTLEYAFPVGADSTLAR